MTKSTITRERLEALANAEYCKSNPGAWLLGLKEVNELARMALAAMESEPDCNERQLFCSTDTARMKKVISVSAGSEATPLYRHAQPAPVVPEGLRMALSNAGIAAPESDEMLAATHEKYVQALVMWVRDRKPFQPAQVVPDDVLDALQKVARIRLDLNDFDGDRRGIADCLCEAEEALIEVVNRRAAMLSGGKS